MNLRDLQYLVVLAEQLHFGKAAEICCVSQPALSMQLKKLENTLGVQLLERTNKSVLLTEIGTVMADRARDILHQTKEMRELAKLFCDPYSGELQIGIIPTLAPYLLPQIIPKLTQTFPKLRIYLVEEQTNSLIKKLHQGKLDAAFLALPVLEDTFTSVSLFEEEFMLALPKTHIFAKQRSIQQSDLQDHILLLLEDGHCLREHALALCHKMNAVEASNFRATSLETLRHMVAAGIGITLMPKLACRANDGITYIPFSTPKPKRTLGLIWRKSSAKKALLKDVSRTIKIVGLT